MIEFKHLGQIHERKAKTRDGTFGRSSEQLLCVLYDSISEHTLYLMIYQWFELNLAKYYKINVISMICEKHMNQFAES